MTRFRRVIHVFHSQDFALEYACEMICAGGAVTKAGSSKRLGISQPHLNNMLRGQIKAFSLNMLTKLAYRAEDEEDSLKGQSFTGVSSKEFLKLDLG
ncbi:hypothetical protein [Parvibaculum sp.]|uniref:hypothetical protein n=1 Tax=Parvibaculum sp. TaxID=2024848 RepID=UPI0039198089